MCWLEIGLNSLGLATKGLTVEMVFSMTWTNMLEASNVIPKFLDVFNLFMQVVALNKVSHLQQ